MKRLTSTGGPLFCWNSGTTTATSKLHPGRLSFLWALLLVVLPPLVLIVCKRLPRGHDAFQYFALQYYFLNGAVTSGEIPLWMPYMTHGSVANWWYAVQAAPFQRFLLLVPRLVEHLNFLPLFYLGLLFDELLLFAGTWLLARRFFRRMETVFFVAIAVCGSSIWISQPWHNFHFYSSIPLVLAFGHRLIETGRIRFLLLAGILVATQPLGSLPYQLPVVTFAIAWYFFVHFLAYPEDLRRLFELRSRPAPVIGALAVVGLYLAAVVLVLDYGTESIANYNAGRSSEGTVSFEELLIYGRVAPILQWLELVTGVVIRRDYSVHIGFIPFGFALLAVFCCRSRAMVPVLLTVLVLGLFSSGYVVTWPVYSIWPMMKYYRLLDLSISLTRMFLCFLAGFGVELILQRQAGSRLIPLSTGLLTVGLLFLVWGSYLASPGTGAGWASAMMSGNGREGSLSMLPRLEEPGFVTAQFQFSILKLAVSGILFVLLGGAVRRSEPGRFFRPAVATVFICAFGELLDFKLRTDRDNTFAVNSEQYATSSFQPMPYSPRREPDLRGNRRFSGFRDEILAHGSKIDSPPYLDSPFSGFQPSTLWAYESFFFADLTASPFRTDHWLAPLDDFLRSCAESAGAAPEAAQVDPFERILGVTFLRFPTGAPACGKVAGLSRDKLQLFSNAIRLPADQAVAAAMTADPAGERLFVADPQLGGADRPPISSGEDASVPLPAPILVKSFSANRLELEVGSSPVPGTGRRPWLLFSDVWHPFWKATVNGHPAAVLKANLAYKAVELDTVPGTVMFSFESRLLSALSLLFGLDGLFWICFVPALLFRAFFVSFPGGPAAEPVSPRKSEKV